MANLVHSFRRMIIKAHRKALARSVFKQHAGVIQRGPFSGVKFDGQANISEAAHGLKIFGLYEEPVMEQLLGRSGVDTFIDVGAGDGYYPVSLLTIGAYRQALGFEATEAGRAAITRNAKLNSVEDRLRIFGRAGVDFIAQLQGLKIDWRATVLLIDIEGAEFNLISDELLTLTRGACYLIELHDAATSDPAARAKLLTRLSAHWNTRIIRDRARDWQDIDELKTWHDLDRAILLSEGRKIIGEWLLAEPK